MNQQNNQHFQEMITQETVITIWKKINNLLPFKKEVEVDTKEIDPIDFNNKVWNALIGYFLKYVEATIRNDTLNLIKQSKEDITTWAIELFNTFKKESGIKEELPERLNFLLMTNIIRYEEKYLVEKDNKKRLRLSEIIQEEMRKQGDILMTKKIKNWEKMSAEYKNSQINLTENKIYLNENIKITPEMMTSFGKQVEEENKKEIDSIINHGKGVN